MRPVTTAILGLAAAGCSVAAGAGHGPRHDGGETYVLINNGTFNNTPEGNWTKGISSCAYPHKIAQRC